MASSAAWTLKNGDLDQARSVITAANVNTDLDGRKPIHYAADYGQNAIIEYLLSIGADINAVDSHGITPLLAAIWEGHTNTVKLLLTKGARPDATAPDGKSYADCADTAEIKRLLTTQNCC